MWPVNEEIQGSVEAFEVNARSKIYTRDQCNNLSTLILNTLRDHTLQAPNEDETTFFDDDYHYFKVYWSPAFDNRQYQEDLNEF